MKQRQRPNGVSDKAELSRVWIRDGYKCELWTAYKYVAGVIDGELVLERSDVIAEAVIKELHKHIEYSESKRLVKDRYRCPVCENRIVTDSDEMLSHLIDSHPERVFG